MLKRSVIITAGGIGKRMGTEIPKQFLLLKGKPIILHTIEKFHAFDPSMEIVVVLPDFYIPQWEILCQKFLFTTEHKVVAGGEERFYSIQNGLTETSGDIIAVHDAVRPCVSEEVIQNCFNNAEQFGTAVPVLSIAESLRKLEAINSIAVNREDYKIVQTPQCFLVQTIKEAFEQEYTPFFTDDATVLEGLDETINLVEGNVENIKITTPYDLKFAELYL